LRSWERPAGFQRIETSWLTIAPLGPKGRRVGAGLWDHWPIGWLNSQTSVWKPGSPYAYSFGSIGQFFVPDGQRIRSFWKDYSAYCKDMELNRWTERRIFTVLLGRANDWDEVSRIGRAWLDKGADCTSLAGPW